MTKQSISAFFPVLNEEGTVKKLTEDLRDVLASNFKEHEIIIVNDGSTDRTAAIADQLCRENNGCVKVIHHKKSMGYGNALKAGFDAARYELVFFTDGDYQFDMNDLNRVIPYIKDNDIVVGYRQDRKDSRHRIWLSRGYNMLIRILFGLKLKDIDSSFKLFKRSALKQITIESEGYFIDTELMVKAKKKDLRIKEIGVSHLPRTSGESKVRMTHIFTTLHEIAVLRKKLR